MAGLARAIRRGIGLLPCGWTDFVRQLGLFGGAYYLYRVVRGIVDGQTTAAFVHARQLIDIEGSLGLFFEPGLQDWAQQHAPWLITGANFLYVNSHFAITWIFLGWLYIARNEAFYFVRNMFMLSMGLALALYAAYPTAPPRFLPEWGFSDTVARFVGPAAENTAGLLYNPYAALPSMHVAFALMVGVPAAMLVRRRALKLLWGIYPAVVTLVVIVTANHFWLDAAVGAAVAAASAWAASTALARVRPEVWAWRPAKVTA